MSILGVVVLLILHPIVAFWSAFSVAFYVLVYTMWLKRRTPQNIVIGGIAGATPPLIGWAAAAEASSARIPSPWVQRFHGRSSSSSSYGRLHISGRWPCIVRESTLQLASR